MASSLIPQSVKIGIVQRQSGAGGIRDHDIEQKSQVGLCWGSGV